MLLLLLACADPDKPADDTGGPDTDTGDTDDTDDTDTGGPAAAVEVRVVDPAGAPVDVESVSWFDPTPLPVPMRGALAALDCAEGAPPCSVWTLDGELPTRVQLVTEWWGDDSIIDGITGATCWPWGAPWTVVHPADTPQVVHLVVDSEQLWCDDGVTFYASPPLVPPTVHPADERVAVEAPAAALTVLGVDAAGLALPLAAANWYFSPEGPDYDGEHPLVCADALCTTWVLPEGEGPTAGEVYVNATWMGPLHPLFDPTYMDYQGALTTPGATVTLTFDTTIALVE